MVPCVGAGARPALPLRFWGARAEPLGAQADSDGTFGRAGLQRGANKKKKKNSSLGHVEAIADR